MKISNLAAFGLLLTLGAPEAQAGKVVVAKKVSQSIIRKDPYKYTGVVTVPGARGSGFCAWNRNTFFTAAHVVYDAGQWVAPPTWYLTPFADTLDEMQAIPSRGYYRWISYADLVADPSDGQAEFGRDMALAYGYRNFVFDRPARVNKKGLSQLASKSTPEWMITGYPAKDPYHNTDLLGYYLYQTGPTKKQFSGKSGNYIQVDGVSTGPGNSGGPIWTNDPKVGWSTAGVYVGYMPGETVVYPFNSDISTMFRAVSPVLKPRPGKPLWDARISSSSIIFPNYEKKVIPDGVPKYTSFRFGVDKFETGALVTKLKLSLEITTKHRGDLLVILEGPTGVQALVSWERGGEKNNLVVKDKDFTSKFGESEANGFWYLRVQDRLKGDKATFKSATLEISTDGGEEEP